jgi:transposase
VIAASVQTKVYLARAATDMRKGFPGLIALTETVLRQDPASGHWFVFINRRRDLIKILYWDGSGFCIWNKRLERGRFQVPAVAAGENLSGLELTAVQLSLILQGIDLTSARQRLRYHRGPREPLPAPGTPRYRPGAAN